MLNSNTKGANDEIIDPSSVEKDAQPRIRPVAASCSQDKTVQINNNLASKIIKLFGSSQQARQQKSQNQPRNNNDAVGASLTSQTNNGGGGMLLQNHRDNNDQNFVDDSSSYTSSDSSNDQQSHIYNKQAINQNMIVQNASQNQRHANFEFKEKIPDENGYQQALDNRVCSSETRETQLNNAAQQENESKEIQQVQSSDGRVDNKTSNQNGNNGAKNDINPPMPLQPISRSYSLRPDMIQGWKPEDVKGAPIPLYYDYEIFEVPTNPETGEDYPVYFFGKRYKDSLEMHRAFANRPQCTGPDTMPSYYFKFPPCQNVIDAISCAQKKNRTAVTYNRCFTGMHPLILPPPNVSTSMKIQQTIKQLEPQKKYLIQNGCALDDPNFKPIVFDSDFESGNLDMVIQTSKNEFDLYMRVDSNTRGHHQWFNFRIKNQNQLGTVKFNIINFTKKNSLYLLGMRVNVKSMQNLREKQNRGEKIENDGWVKSGTNITYNLSKISQNYQSNYNSENVPKRRKKYYQMSFEFDFKNENDETYFSYALPYPFTKLHNLLKQLTKDHQEKQPNIQNQYVKEGKFCNSLSGLDVPELTITTRVNQANFAEVDRREFIREQDVPVYKYKKYIIVCARVHPGESNASFVMQGFLKFIFSQHEDARELRKKFIFKLVPMTNPDGVIAGNYRTSMSGNDLNRQFINPNPRLHPTVCAIKKLVQTIQADAQEAEPITAFIDIHGHSRKKSVFMYGPYQPLHSEKYLKMRVLPKLLDERSPMFRFYSCKFQIEKSKLRAARVVLFKEFGIMNCFTLEASFHGYIDKDRNTVELTTDDLEVMGKQLGQTFTEYSSLVDEDDRQRKQIRDQIKMKKKSKIAAAALKASKQARSANDPKKQQLSLQETENDDQIIDLTTTPSADTSMITQSGKQSESTTTLRRKNNSSTKILSKKPANSLARAKQMGEIISEEDEISCCKSEGSPTKVNKKKNNKENKNHRKAKKSVSQQASLIGMVPRSGTSSNNVKKADTDTNLNDIINKQQQSGVSPKIGGLSACIAGQQKRTLSSIYKDLKKKPPVAATVDDEEEEQEKLHRIQDDEDDAGYDSSGQSELSDNERKQVQGDILGALNKFEALYQGGGNNVNSKKPPLKDKQRKKKKREKQNSNVPSVAVISSKREPSEQPLQQQQPWRTGTAPAPSSLLPTTSSQSKFSNHMLRLKQGEIKATNEGSENYSKKQHHHKQQSHSIDALSRKKKAIVDQQAAQSFQNSMNNNKSYSSFQQQQLDKNSQKLNQNTDANQSKLNQKNNSSNQQTNAGLSMLTSKSNVAKNMSGLRRQQTSLSLQGQPAFNAEAGSNKQRYVINKACANRKQISINNQINNINNGMQQVNNQLISLCSSGVVSPNYRHQYAVHHMTTNEINTSSVEGLKMDNKLPLPKKQRCTSSPVKKKDYRLNKNVSMDKNNLQLFSLDNNKPNTSGNQQRSKKPIELKNNSASSNNLIKVSKYASTDGDKIKNQINNIYDENDDQKIQQSSIAITNNNGCSLMSPNLKTPQIQKSNRANKIIHGQIQNGDKEYILKLQNLALNTQTQLDDGQVLQETSNTLLNGNNLSQDQINKQGGFKGQIQQQASKSQSSFKKKWLNNYQAMQSQQQNQNK